MIYYSPETLEPITGTLPASLVGTLPSINKPLPEVGFNQHVIADPEHNNWIVVTSIPLDDLRSNQRNILKQSRDSIIQSPIDNFQVASSQDRENIKDSVANWEMLGVESIEWVMVDNTTRTVTKADLESVIQQYAIRKLQAFAQFNQLCEVLETSDNPESVTWESE